VDFDWWTVAVDPLQLRFSPDNPNWLGAFSLSEGNGSIRDLTFRAVKGSVAGQQHLFLSWICRNSALDIVNSSDYLNIILGAGANYVALQVVLGTSSQTVCGTQDPPSVFAYRMQACNVVGSNINQGAPLGSDGAALETTARMWIDVDAPMRGLHSDWAFQMAIPLGVAWAPSALTLPASGAFQLWYEGWSSLPASMQAGPYKVPTSSMLDTGNDQTVIVPAGMTKSNLLDMTTAAGGDAGVELQWGNVGSRNVNVGDPARNDSSTIRLDLGQQYPPNKALNNGPLYDEMHTPNVTNSQFRNQIYAQPTFPVGFAGNKEAMRARFSLANWGSQFSDPTSNSWSPMTPNGLDVQYLNANSEARFDWPAGMSADAFVTKLVRNVNKFLNATGRGLAIPADAQNPHQCMLVELSSTDPSIIITRSSIYQNMNVAQASTFRRFAQVSVVGLTPISPKPRDVYLYLQTFNMPAQVDKPPANVPGIANNLTAMASTRQPRHEVEDYAAFVPTYIVHAYHDTGRKKKLLTGKTVTVVYPQTAFGYFMEHEGDLVGWDSRIYGAEKLTDRYYVVRVPNNGATYVETAIQARANASEAPLPPDGEKPKKPGGCPLGCLGSLLTLFGLGRQ
jgi:hypothetical protein